MGKFSRNDSEWLWSGSPKKIRLLKYKHIIYHFKAHDLKIPLIIIFCEIFKFPENTSKKIRELSQSVHKIVKFKYFAKVITYSKSPGYVLQR